MLVSFIDKPLTLNKIVVEYPEVYEGHLAKCVWALQYCEILRVCVLDRH